MVSESLSPRASELLVGPVMWEEYSGQSSHLIVRSFPFWEGVKVSYVRTFAFVELVRQNL